MQYASPLSVRLLVSFIDFRASRAVFSFDLEDVPLRWSDGLVAVDMNTDRFLLSATSFGLSTLRFRSFLAVWLVLGCGLLVTLLLTPLRKFIVRLYSWRFLSAVGSRFEEFLSGTSTGGTESNVEFAMDDIDSLTIDKSSRLLSWYKPRISNWLATRKNSSSSSDRICVLPVYKYCTIRFMCSNRISVNTTEKSIGIFVELFDFVHCAAFW